jgi:hypothetical protein
MQFYRRHWYEIGGAIFVALAYCMGFWGDHFSQIQAILTYSFMGMLVHQFEEYAMPGGLPGIANIALCGEREAPDRYPLNANQVMISNVFLTYPFYIVPILFPNLIWLGLIQIGQGLSQVVPHGVVMNIMLKRPYNPGAASSVLIQLPLGIYYIWFVHTHHLAATSDFVIGLVGTLVALVVLWLGPIWILRDRKSKYPFTECQMFRYAHEKLKRMLQQ